LRKYRNEIVSGIITTVYLSASMAFARFLSGNIQLSHTFSYWGIFFTLFLTSFLFVINAKRFLWMMFEKVRENHFEVMSKLGVTVVGFLIEKGVNEVIIITEKDMQHIIIEDNVKYVEVVSTDGMRRRMSLKQFMDTFPKEDNVQR